MVEDNRKIDYLVGQDGIKYKVILEPVKSEKAAVRVRHKPRKFTIKFLFVAIVISLGVGIFSMYKLGVFYATPVTTIAPDSLVSKAKGLPYPLFYPTVLPTGYSFEEESLFIEENVLFFSLTSKDRKIAFTEQLIPNTAPDFNFRNIKKTETNLGQVITGLAEGDPLLPVVVVLTDKTMINISTSFNLPTEDLVKLADKLGRVYEASNN